MSTLSPNVAPQLVLGNYGRIRFLFCKRFDSQRALSALPSFAHYYAQPIGDKSLIFEHLAHPLKGNTFLILGSWSPGYAWRSYLVLHAGLHETLEMMSVIGEELKSRMRLPAARLRSEWRGHLDWVSASVTLLESLCEKTLRDENNEEPMIALRSAREMELLCVSIISAIEWCGERYGHDESFEAALGEARSAERRCSACASTSSVALLLREHRAARCALRDAEDAYEHRESLEEWLDPETHPATQLRSWRRGDFSSALRLIYACADLAALASDDHRAGIVVAADIATRGIVSESEARAATAIWLSDFADGMRCAGNDDAAESATISCAWMASRAGFDDNVSARLAVSRRLGRLARYAPDAVLASLAALEDASDDRFRAARRNAWLQLDNPRQALAAVRASPDPALRHPVFKHLVESNRRELAVCLAAADPDEVSLAHFCDDRTAAAFLLSRRRYADLLRLFRGTKQRDKLAETAIRMAANAHPPVSWSPPPSTFALHYVANLKKQQLPHVDLIEPSRKNKIARCTAEHATNDIMIDSASQPITATVDAMEEEDNVISMEEEHDVSVPARGEHIIIEKDEDGDTEMLGPEAALVEEAEETVAFENGVAARSAEVADIRNLAEVQARYEVDDHSYGYSDYPLPPGEDGGANTLDAAEEEHEASAHDEAESSHLASPFYKVKPTRNKNSEAHYDEEEAVEQEEYSDEVIEQEDADEENEDVEEGVKLLSQMGHGFAFYSDYGDDEDEEVSKGGMEKVRNDAVEGDETEDEEIYAEQVEQDRHEMNVGDEKRDLSAGDHAGLDVEIIDEVIIAVKQSTTANQEDGDAGAMNDEARREEGVVAVGGMDIDQIYEDEPNEEDLVMVEVPNIGSEKEGDGRIRIKIPLSSVDTSGTDLDALKVAAESDMGNVMSTGRSDTTSNEAKDKGLFTDLACREHLAVARSDAGATEEVMKPYDVGGGREGDQAMVSVRDPVENHDGRASGLDPSNKSYEGIQTAQGASEVAANYDGQFRVRFADEYAVSAAIAVAELASLPAHHSHLVDEGVEVEDAVKFSTTAEQQNAEAEGKHGKIDMNANANDVLQQGRIEQEHAAGYASALDVIGAEAKHTNEDTLAKLAKCSHVTVDSHTAKTARDKEAEPVRQSADKAECGENLRLLQEHVADTRGCSWAGRMKSEAVRADVGESSEATDQHDRTNKLMSCTMDAASHVADSGPAGTEDSIQEQDATMEQGIDSAKTITIVAYEGGDDQEERDAEDFAQRKEIVCSENKMMQEEVGARVSVIEDADSASQENDAGGRCSLYFASKSLASPEDRYRDAESDEPSVDQDDEEEDGEEEDGDDEEDFCDDMQSDKDEDNDGPPEASNSMGADESRDNNSDHAGFENSQRSRKSRTIDAAMLPTRSQQSLSGIPEDTDIALRAEYSASGKPVARGRARARRLSTTSNASTKSRSSTTSLTDIDVSNIIHTSRRRNVPFAPRGSR